ncbi:MAG: translocation/assembly module TamB domain-containing protein [Ignavibacteria bacterium]
MKLRLDSKHRLRYKSTAYKVFHFIGKSLLFLFILFLIFVGFTQTSYFRNLLRDKIIEYAKDELNGNLQIESIYGTLFSSLTIKNLNYSIEGVELISAKTIHLSINPIALFQKKIVVNKLFLENVRFNFIQFKDGKWITEKILKHPAPEDTTPTAKLDYEIILKKISFSDCQFRHKTNSDSTDYYKYTEYKTFNYNDLLLSSLNLDLSARVNLIKNIYEVNLQNFSFRSNVKNFSLVDFDVNLIVKDKSLKIDPIKIKTTNSDISLKSEIKDFDLSDENYFVKFPQKIFNALLDAQPFDFYDLYVFIPDLNMLKGKVFVKAEANGSLENLKVDYIEARFDSTNLNLQGVLFNLNDPDKLYIKAKIKDTEVLMNDVSNLLPLYGIPKFDGLGKLNLDISYEGSPLNFKTDFKILTQHGDVSGLAAFNFNRRVPSYNIELLTRGLGIKPFLKVNGHLNSNLIVKGEGFDPKHLNSYLFFKVMNSQVSENQIDSLVLNIVGQKEKINVNFDAISEELKLALNGYINFKNEENPNYDVSFNGSNIDLRKDFFLKDFTGKLNLAGDLKGAGFDPDNLEGVFNLKIFNSVINNQEIDQSELKLDIHHNNGNEKTIRLSSNFIDFVLNGNYKFTEILKVIPEKIELITQEIEKKKRLFNGDTIPNISIVKLGKKEKKKSRQIEKFYEEPEFNFSYKFNFKDFTLINAFLKNIKINLDGNINGKVLNDKEKFVLENESNIQDFWIVDIEQSQRIKNASIKISFEASNREEQKNQLNLVTSIQADKIFSSIKVENLDLNIDFTSDLFGYKIQSTIDSVLFVRSEGNFDISSQIFKASINKATIEYKKYKLTNQGPLNFSFSKEKIEFDQFVLRRKKELFKLSGELGYYGSQDLNFEVTNLELYDLVLNLLPNITEEINGQLSISLSLKGIAESPVINGSFNLENLSIGNDRLGELTGRILYSNKLVNVFTTYVDSIYAGKDFDLKGSIPIDLSFKNVKERIYWDREINFTLNLEDFNLQPLRAIIPTFKTINGAFNGNLRITGTLNEPELYGSIVSKDMNFVLAQNNLTYSSDIKINLNKDKIILEKFELANLKTSKRGRLYTNGEVVIDKRGLKNLKITTVGNLLVLGNESKAVSPNVYGDLFIETSSPIVLEGSYNEFNIRGDVNIKETALIIPPIQTEYGSEEESFVYKLIDYSPQIDQADLAFIQAEKELRGKKKIQTQNQSGVLSKISGKIKISLKNSVSMLLIFNQELNQRLFADLKGEVIYNFSEGQTSTQGEIELTQDSYLVFYQRFLASGKIRFERDLANPYLDVVATYSNYYIQGDTVNQVVKDVVIKLKLIGTVTELGKNLISNPENIEVSIDGNLDRTKDASDVVAFILIGKFKDDLTAQDKTGALSNWGGTFQSAASSLLGSVITNFANSVLGDVLRNVEFKKVGEETKFSFEGRVKDVRFKVGGGTDVFQNFALANIQIEYPVSDKLFLRLVRKQSQVQASKQYEMINEVGLKYKVEF